MATTAIIMMQKNSDGIFSSSKAFGARGRSNTVIKLTYILGAMFLLNSMVLGILYQKKYKANLIKETSVIKTETIKEQPKSVK